MITEKIDQYLHKFLAEEDNEEGEEIISTDNAQKVMHLAAMMDMKKQAPRMKRVIGKALQSKPLSDSERMVLKDMIGRWFRPDKNKFRRLMKKF